MTHTRVSRKRRIQHPRRFFKSMGPSLVFSGRRRASQRRRSCHWVVLRHHLVRHVSSLRRLLASKKWWKETSLFGWRRFSSPSLQNISDEEMMSEGGNHPSNDRARDLPDLWNRLTSEEHEETEVVGGKMGLLSGRDIWFVISFWTFLLDVFLWSVPDVCWWSVSLEVSLISDLGLQSDEHIPRPSADLHEPSFFLLPIKF